MKSRGVIIAGNWKMNHLAGETATFISQLKARSGTLGPALSSAAVTAAIAPSYLALGEALQSARDLDFPLHIAAQNAHWEKKGAFTGEISGPMLKELGISWAIVGHSERRQYFAETDETARKRAESLLEQGFRVILCIGETRAEREAGQTSAVLERQLGAVLRSKEALSASLYLDGKLIIAYEPVWAIGTGLTATPEQAQEAHRMIRNYLSQWQGAQAAGRTSILYGGSVTPENIDSLLSCADVDGALVGGASLKAESYLQLLSSSASAALRS